MLFVSNYPLTIDAKNRLAIPSELRSRLRRESKLKETDSVPFYVTIAKQARALSLYPAERFEQLLDRASTPGKVSPQTYLAVQRLSAVSWAAQTDKQGRILLPERLLQDVPLPSQVILAGLNDHLEIWEPGAWTEFLAAAGDYDDPAELMALDPMAGL